MRCALLSAFNACAAAPVPRPPPANGPAWYFYDDTQVTKIRKKEQDAVFQANPDVYLVFYERVPPGATAPAPA